MKKVPIWLADDPNSGVFVYWMTMLFELPLDEIVFVSDSTDINPGLSQHFITSQELIDNRYDYHLPIMNLGVSSYYAKQIRFLLNHGGFVFFHQLFLQKIIETYFIRGETPAERDLCAYGRREGGRAAELLADIGARGGLDVSEYYLRTFAVQLADKAIGFCSSWKGCAELLRREGLNDDDADRFFYVPPAFSSPSEVSAKDAGRKPFNKRPLRLALLGHKSPMKNPAYCLEVVRALNAQGTPAKLVTIGTIGDLVAAEAGPLDRRYHEHHVASQHSRFLKLIDGVDLNLHFRHPFGGEMSLTICETMARGVPTAGYAKDWLLDLPEDVWIGAEFGRPPEEAAARIAAAAGTPEKIEVISKRVMDYVRAADGTKGALGAVLEIIDYVRSSDGQAQSRTRPRLVG